MTIDTNKAREKATRLAQLGNEHALDEITEAAALLLALAAERDRDAKVLKAVYAHLGGDNPIYAQEQPYGRDLWQCSGCSKTETAWYENGELEPNPTFAHNPDCVWVKVKCAIDAAMGESAMQEEKNG